MKPWRDLSIIKKLYLVIGAMAILIACGNSICGNSAIAAVALNAYFNGMRGGVDAAAEAAAAGREAESAH